MKILPIAAMAALSGCCLQIVTGVGLSDADAGIARDAGALRDGGNLVDAGNVTDAGDAIDAGNMVDAGSMRDAGDDIDAGNVPDAGTQIDAGGQIDAGSDGGMGCTPDSGATIYAHSPDALYRIDPITWAPTLVGSFGVDSMTDLAISPANEIYVTSFSSLYTVNPASGAATLLMQLNADFDALTFLADGTLLGAAGSGAVSRVDLVHQTVDYVGSYGDGYSSSGDLVAVADGTLYATSLSSPGVSGGGDFLIKVDPKTGAATTVGAVGFQNVWGLGYYYGTVIAFTAGGQVLKINPVTGAGTLLASSSVPYWGAGVTPAVAANCP